MMVNRDEGTVERRSLISVTKVLRMVKTDLANGDVLGSLLGITSRASPMSR